MRAIYLFLVFTSLISSQANAGIDIDHGTFGTTYSPIRSKSFVMTKCQEAIDEVKRNYSRVFAGQTSYVLKGNVFQEITRYVLRPNDVACLAQGLCYDWGHVRTLDYPLNVQRECRGVSVDLKSLLIHDRGWLSYIKSQVNCEPRNAAEKAAMALAKKCTIDPTDICFTPEYIQILESIKPTQVSYRVAPKICR